MDKKTKELLESKLDLKDIYDKESKQNESKELCDAYRKLCNEMLISMKKQLKISVMFQVLMFISGVMLGLALAM